MIPIKLTLQGLYSYQERQTIDFSKLIQAGLFGIFGSVGSGKSSILEAISFALYGESERLNARENRNYNMMNLKSNELLIDFDFKANDNFLYRFVVKSKRNSKRFDDVKTFERAAYKFENDNWIPIDVRLAETITGLNYVNFKRTIIIPQGRFQEFLQLSPGDRTTMLKELFNLSKYDLSDKIIRLEGKNNAALQHLEGQLQEVGEMQPEKIETLEKELLDINEKLKNENVDLLEKQKIEQEFEVIKKLSNSLKLQKENWLGFQNSEKEIENLETEIQQFEKLSLAFRSDFDRYALLQRSIQVKMNDVRNLENDSKQSKLFEDKLKLEFSSLKPKFERKELLQKEAEELIKLAEIQENKSKSIELEIRLKNGKTTLEDVQNLIKTKKEEKNVLTKTISDLKQNLPDFKVLNEVKEWFLHQNNFDKTIHEIQKRNEISSQKKLSIEERISKLYSESKLFSSSLNMLEIENVLSKLKGFKLLMEQKKEEINSEIVHLEVQNKLGQFADTMEDGKACPLCGSEHHPQIMNPENVADQLKSLKVQMLELDDKIQSNQKLQNEFVIIGAELQSLENQIIVESESLIKAQEDLENHLQKFVWKDFDSSNQQLLKDAFEQFEIQQNLINTSEANLLKTAKEIESKEEEKEKYAQVLRSFEEQILGFQSNITLLSSQIQVLEIESYKDFQPEQLRKLSSEKLIKQKEIVRNFEVISENLQKNQNEISRLSGAIQEAKNSLESFNTENNLLWQTIENKLLAAGNLTFEFVDLVLKKNLSLDVSKTKIAKFRKEFDELKFSISELEKEIAGRIYDEELHIQIKIQIADLKQFIDSEMKRSGELSNELKQLKSDLEKFAKLKAEHDTLKLRAQDISELKNLFRGSAFVNFVSTVYLENLCRAANERLYKLTRQKLGLELSEENSFLVRDYMNEGKLRSVKTLSGGQTFQASLSLALSLADSIHKSTGSSENFFFLDEGFGTLDKDSLEVVFESLKALRKENRIVGVISHVEEMQQQIETFISVVNDEENGSLLKMSWET